MTPESFYKRIKSRTENRAKVVSDLVDLGPNAIPIIKGLLDGANEFGIQYINTGLITDSLIVAASRLKPYLTEDIILSIKTKFSDHPYINEYFVESGELK